MEVDPPVPPPSMVSPPPSPTGPASLPPAGKPGEGLIAVIGCENEKSAFASLQRTLKKSNLKSIKPKLHERSTKPGIFCYKLSSEINRFPHIYSSILKNWISVEQASIEGFCTERQGEEPLYYPSKDPN